MIVIKNNSQLEYDIVVNFELNSSISCKIVRLKDLSENILSRFNNFKEANSLFLRSVALSVAMSSSYKYDGVFKMQIMPTDNAIIKAILVDNKNNGDVRALISLNDDVLLRHKSENIGYIDMVGLNGHMLFHLDQKMGTPYQAIVSLIGKSIDDSFNNWFKQSEQTNTYVKSFANEEGNAFALFLQTMPAKSSNINLNREETENTKYDLLNTAIILSNTLSEKEVFNDSLENIIYNLFNEFTITIYDRKQLFDNCSCSIEKIQDVINSLQEDEKNELKDSEGKIESQCSFCKKIYYIT